MRDRVVNLGAYAFLVLLTSALFYLQIIKFPHYDQLARNNVIRIIPIDGPRGNIFDRRGKALVSNRLSFDAAVVYQELKDQEKLVKILNESLGVSRKDVMKSLEEARFKPYVPVTVAEDIDRDRALALEEMSPDIRGLIVETRSRRNYIYGDAGCHIFGYLSEINEEELGRLKDYGYRMKDLLGRDGLERYYNEYLAGTDGGLQIEVDNRGRQVRTLGLKEPSSGKDLYLTIDAKLQMASDKLLGEHSGAVIAMEPKSGEILALASHPAFDPNIFVRPETSAQRLELLGDRRGRPLLNRAVSGVYPPGSIFKVVTAAAALETKRITPNTVFTCTGSYSLGGTKFDCWKDTGHGPQDVTDGLKNSCNVFFYNAGRAAGVDNIEAFARLFGFGGKTGIDLPDEAAGLVPGKRWKRFYKRDKWYEGDTLNYAIGQGYLLVTPIEILEMISVIANGGELVRPHIVKKIDTLEVAKTNPKKILLRGDVLKTIREGLFKVVDSEDGTGRHARVEGIKIAGKTGTAQNPKGPPHAWFTGFAPYQDPKICLVVVLEHGGKGSLEPAEIAKGMFEEARRLGYL